MSSALQGPTTFADDGSAVLSRVIEVPVHDEIPRSQIEDAYDIDRTVSYLNSSEFSKIALQFPDELLADAAQVSTLLKAQTGRDIYVLADTTFGSCCVDEIAAEHAYAELVIHYGRACLSPTSRIPVFYVFPKAAMDVGHCVEAFKQVYARDLEQPILIMSDVVHQHSMDALVKALSAGGYTGIIPSYIASATYDPRPASKGDAAPLSAGCCQKTETCCRSSLHDETSCDRSPTSVTAPIGSRKQCSRRYSLADNQTLANYSIFYVGAESLSLTNLVITHNTNEISSYDPLTKIIRNEKTNSGRLLMRRYFMVQKAKDAEVIGIVVGTLGAANYLAVIHQIQRLISAAGKKSYLLAVGKPNVAKLANFLEVDCFVLVACAENSLLDSKEFLRPIVTPFELELALVDGRDWTGAYETDLEILNPRLASGASELLATQDLRSQAADGTGDHSDEEPYFSLVTGGYKQAPGQATRSARAEAPQVSSADDMGQLTLRNEKSTLTVSSLNSAGARFLNEKRTFRGLVSDVGRTDVTTAVEGRRGIARGYIDETGKSDQMSK
ncbi:diphthamide biosynthesis protein 2 [Powellomyces hirtus]|nr:diphthamide biosynthesis protein 2 [Powellomyces hirtus]